MGKTGPHRIKIGGRRIPPDNSDIVVWTGAGTGDNREGPVGRILYNSGSSGSQYDLNSQTTTQGVYFNQVGLTTTAYSGIASVSGAFNFQPTTCTISGWVMLLTSSGATFGRKTIVTRQSGSTKFNNASRTTLSIEFATSSLANQKSMFATIARTSNGYMFEIFSGSQATAGQWHHVGLTFDGSTGEKKSYFDGVLLSTASNGSSVLAYGQNSAQDLWILGSLGDGKGAMIISDLRIANIVRPDTFFKKSYRYGLGLHFEDDGTTDTE